MRITGGQWRSRVLEAPKGADIVRPTSDKVRLAIMNMLDNRGLIEDAVVLDVFCGTGALGLEALSRGAAQCVFIDNNKAALMLAKKNAESLKAEKTEFVFSDAAKLPQAHVKAHLVFLDPPYKKDLVAPAIDALKAKGWCAEGCVFCVETEVTFSFEEKLVEKIYGETKVTFIQ